MYCPKFRKASLDELIAKYDANVGLCQWFLTRKGLFMTPKYRKIVVEIAPNDGEMTQSDGEIWPARHGLISFLIRLRGTRENAESSGLEKTAHAT